MANTSESDNRAETDHQAIAVALQRSSGAGDRPQVVASGRGALAEQILEIAFDRGVKVREDADLAEILAAVEVDCEVPLEALAAVAEILSYVYQSVAPREGVANTTIDHSTGAAG